MNFGAIPLDFDAVFLSYSRGCCCMSDGSNFKDPFNIWYLLAALGVLMAMPLLNMICGWFVFYITK